MGAPIVHFEINVKDGKRAQEFYRNLFNWNIRADNPMNYGLVNTGSKRGIQGGIGQLDENGSPYVAFYIEVDDPQAYLDKVTSMGGRTIMPVTEIPSMVTFAQFADPEGNIIGLVKSATPAPRPRKATARKKTAKKRTRSRR